MLIRRSASAVRVWAPAKVNLFLEVLARRADGYHELATLMLAVSLYDTLEFTEEPTGATVLHCDHPSLSTGPDNLICRAVELARRESGRSDGVGIRLWKRIPMAAGLAGGSSDAAATLAGLNRLWRLGWSCGKMARLGAELGSDVSFFFAAPVAWCTGRGEQIEPLRLGRPLDLVLVAPSVGLSTAEVFRGVTVPTEPRSGAAVRQAAAEGDVEELGRQLHNRLQPAAERLSPDVAELCARLLSLGPAGQLMTGSGSTVFALCRSPGEALSLARDLNSARDELNGARVFVVGSCD
ncbi:MAG TPA: 4-(cytidine 5'-diphospho)-2-C-methyl-D-erythritol kinase [Gemmataceae bacterium]|nr:4-(cytidine 5'-diphospho)-2-C-methyl-D-erythritol kinase [Gemmataceae bacterium]